MSLRCKEGHASEEADYCSTCGVAMGSGSAPAPQSKRAKTWAKSAAACPDCAEPRDADARFCEVCRFDFTAGKVGPPPAGKTAIAPTNMPARWELVLTVDPALDTRARSGFTVPREASPDRMIPFDGAELLVGRQDDQRDIHPEVALADPGSSRRHAKFLHLADGGVALQDLASTNGSKLNAVDVAPGSRHLLKDGDQNHPRQVDAHHASENGMTLDAVDQRLAAWAERLVRMNDNLLALEAEPTFQMLSGTAGTRAPLDGITATRVSPALDALAELFEHRGGRTTSLSAPRRFELR